jgi:hypothetical protein
VNDLHPELIFSLLACILALIFATVNKKEEVKHTFIYLLIAILCGTAAFLHAVDIKRYEAVRETIEWQARSYSIYRKMVEREIREAEALVEIRHRELIRAKAEQQRVIHQADSIMNIHKRKAQHE